jgi:hypothetical protein
LSDGSRSTENGAAEQVAEAAAQEQKANERQQVGVDDPGERRVGEAEVLLDRRQATRGLIGSSTPFSVVFPN